MTLEEYRNNKKGSAFFKKMKKILIKTFSCLVILIIILYMCNTSESTKELVKSEIFQTDFNFSKISKIYNSFFSKKSESKPVSGTSKLVYDVKEKYFDGVKVTTQEDKNVYLINSGIVVFNGEKDNYGNTIIVQQTDGTDVWYGNLENISVNLYDYVSKNTVIATSKEYLYLVFQKNGEYLDYKEYIQ